MGKYRTRPYFVSQFNGHWLALNDVGAKRDATSGCRSGTHCTQNLQGLSAARISGRFGAWLVPVVFSLIVGTVLGYGGSARALAVKLGLAPSRRDGVLFVGANPLAHELALALNQQGVKTVLISNQRARLSPGTLTQNRMTVTVLEESGVRLELDDIEEAGAEAPAEEATLMLVAEALCNDATLPATSTEGGVTGHGNGSVRVTG